MIQNDGAAEHSETCEDMFIQNPAFVFYHNPQVCGKSVLST